MSSTKYLTGDQLSKDKIKEHLNQQVIYLFRKDIDRSGRGYYFPRIGTITSFHRKSVEFNNNQDYRSISDLVEFVLATEENVKANFK